MFFLRRPRAKAKLPTEIRPLIAFTALLNNDKVGLLLFSDTPELLCAAKKRPPHLLRLIRDVIDFAPAQKAIESAPP